MAITHKVVVTGTNNPAYQVSKNPWNDVHEITTTGITPELTDLIVVKDVSNAEELAHITINQLLSLVSTGAITSVNGKTGAVVLQPSDIGLGNVNNTADIDKPISNATATALSFKADISAVNNTFSNLATINGSSLLAGGNIVISGGGATNLSTISITATALTIASDTGSDALIPAATSSLAGLQTAADKTKLDGIAAGATVNSTDAQLRDRGTHTGTQAASTISDFSTATDARITAQKGANNGLAPLDSTGRVPAVNLPSYVDDVLEFANLAGFPATGETAKIYVDLATNLTYRWTGSAYIQVGGASSLPSTSITDFTEAVQDVIGASVVAIANFDAVGFSNLINLSSSKVLAPTVVSGPLTFAPTGSPKEGAEAILLLTADGVNFPDFTAFKEIANSSGYMNVANQINLIVFTYLSGNYLMAVTQVGTASVDSVAPVLSTATIFRDTPTRIDILFSEDMLQLPVPLPESFELTGAGSAGLTITGAAYTGTRGLRLTLSGSAPNAGVINIAYTKPASGSGNEIKDLAGNLLATFAATPVQNNSEVGIALQYPNFGTVNSQLVEVVTPGASSTYTVSPSWTSGEQLITQSDVFIPAATDGFIRCKAGKAFNHFGIGANPTAALNNFNASGQVLSIGAGVGTTIAANFNLWQVGGGITPNGTRFFTVLDGALLEFRRINSSTTPEIQLRGSHDNGNTWALIHTTTGVVNIAAALYPYLYTADSGIAGKVLTEYIVRG